MAGPVATSTVTDVVQTDGLWLIGIGALMLAIVGVLSAPLRLHLQFSGLGDRRSDRLVFAGTGLGLLATSAGSILVAVGSTPASTFIVTTMLILAAVGWLLLAWRVHVLWVARRDETALILQRNQDLHREAWRLDAAALLARWQWCLVHPLTLTDATSWPYPYLEKRIGPEPAGVADEWFSNDGITLRRNRPSLVRLTTTAAPDWPRDVVRIAEDQHWPVLHAGTTVAFYTPDGQKSITIDSEQAPIVRGLSRMQLLHKLKDSGFPTHTSSPGEPLPGSDPS